MAFDHKAGFDYVGYHSYAKRRYYDTSLNYASGYCTLPGLVSRNVKMEKMCGNLDMFVQREGANLVSGVLHRHVTRLDLTSLHVTSRHVTSIYLLSLPGRKVR